MRIYKFILKALICILCVLCLHSVSFAANNLPLGDIGEYGNWLTEDNMESFKADTSSDMDSFQDKFQTKVESETFIPVEVKLGLVFMKALSSIDYVLQLSLVRFAIIFLFVMYVFWLSLEAYKTIRESTDYKKVVYDVFEKGIKIAIWVVILEFGPAKIFTAIITPILWLGTQLSDFILKSVTEQLYNLDIPNTCAVIQDYVKANNTGKMLIDSDTIASIMCLPGRLSTYFYHATAASWKLMIGGFSHSITAIVVGAISVVLFIKCIFKYAFMTLGVVADLFLTLLMLPFTAIAESMPTTSEKNYAAQIFNGFLKVFNTKKLSDVISVFINATIYFVSLSIIIAICAALLANIINISGNNTFSVASAMTTILCGCLVLYLAGKTDELTKQIGGSIDNSFGKQLEGDTKTLWKNTKDFGGKLYKAWVKKK